MVVNTMPEYRRANLPGSSILLTLITYQWDRSFLVPENIDRLRQACNLTIAEKPFTMDTAVILPRTHAFFVDVNT
jgi:putative transposase